MKFLYIALKMHLMLKLDIIDLTLYRLINSKSSNILSYKVPY
jgi:hypothetical protein